MIEWHWLDYVILAAIGLSMLTGLFRGFVKELIAFCIWLLAIWMAYRYSSIVDEWLLPYISERTIRSIMAFVVILLGTLLAGGLINALLSFILVRSGLSGTDRILGMGFGFVRGVFIVALVMLVVQMTSLPYQEYSKSSKLYAKFTPLVGWMSAYVPSLLESAKQFEAEQDEKNADLTIYQNSEMTPNDSLILDIS